MKKILYLSLCAILIINSLVACSDDKNTAEESNAYDLYTKMLAVIADVKSIDMEISVLSDTFTHSSESSGSSTGNIKKVVNSETGEIDIEIDYSLSLDGSIISTIKLYYTNGILYTESAAGKQSLKSPYEQVPFLSNADLLEFPESAVKEFKVSDYNGGKKVEMTLDGSSVKSIIEKNQDEKDYSLGDVVCEFIIDKDNMLKFHRIIYEESMTLEDENMRVKKDVSITVNSYNDVEIELPSDLNDYVNIDF